MNAHVLQTGAVSGRSSVMLLVIGLHLALIMGLMAIKVVVPKFDPGPDRLKVTVVNEPKQPHTIVKILDPSGRSLIPIPQNPLGPDYQKLPDIPGDETLAQPPIDKVSQDPSSVQSIAPTPPEFRVTRSTDDYYPALSIRAGEEGIAQIRVCIAASGEISAAPTIAQSSGFRRLDAAALVWASEALRFTPATQNGQPIAMCKGIKVNFRLQ
jgi:TonB family protein